MSAFKSYTSSAAFRLELSARMIEMIVILGGLDAFACHPHAIRTLNGLRDRGLVEVGTGKEITATNCGWRLTKAGEALLPLLALAGHDLESVRARVLARYGVAA